MKLKRIFAFSLAEALITLLIVSLIALASVPVITKKRRQNDGHGKWMCTLNADGQHVMWTNGSQGQPGSPSTWKPTGKNHCKFTPPSKARNFAITIAGGGGGGAAAGSRKKNWTSDFAVEHPGFYNFIAIGGGGHGGGSTDNTDRSAGGGAGAVVALRVYLSDKVSQIRMERGRKGTCCEDRDGTKNSGKNDATSSVITAVMYNDSGLTESVNLISAGGGQGGHGGEHGGSEADRWVTPPGRVYMNIPDSLKYPTINGRNYNYTYKCYGSIGGGVSNCFNTSACSNHSSTCSNKMWGIVLIKDSHISYKKCSGGYLKKSDQISFNEFFSKDSIKLYPEIECNPNSKVFDRGTPDYKLTFSERSTRSKVCAMPGMGGGSKQSAFPCGEGGSHGSKSGSSGYVMANTTFYFSGGGGEAGDSATNVFYPKFNARSLTVTIGSGGAGGTLSKNSDGTYSASAGQNGGATSIVDDKNQTLLGKVGGSGGRLNYLANALVDTPGQDGGNTKIYYRNAIVRGRGGLTENNFYNKDGLESAGYGDGGGGGGFSVSDGGGVGADGMPGIVIIEW